MIQNLRFIFSHQDIVIFTGIFFIILFLIFPVKKYRLETANRIIAACCLWWILLVFIYPPKGFNYEIYSYNASLTLNGEKAFGRDATQTNDNKEISFKDPKFLDYTGAQHLLYVLLESINLSGINPKLSGLGFQLWTIINVSIIFLLIFYLNKSPGDEVDHNKIWPIIILSFCPVIPLYIIISSWEDKFIFLLLPLLLLFLIQSKRYKASSLLLGFIIAFNGLVIFFFPIYLIFLFREVKEKIWLNLGLILTGIIITMIPFLPESLIAWANRFNKVSIYKPFWLSFYSFLSEGTYSILLNNILLFVTGFAMILLYLFKKINLIDSLIISVSIVIIMSPFNGVARIIPLIMLYSILSPNMNRYNWLTLSILLFVFFLFDTGYLAPIVNTLNTILFYIPLLYSISIYLYKRSFSERNKYLQQVS